MTTTRTAGTLIQTTGTIYDTAGRLAYTFDPADLKTYYDYSTNNRITTVTRPGGATEITETYMDGRVKSITGTGVVHRYYTYGVNNDGTLWTQVNTGSTDSPMWEKTTTDLVGRTLKIEKADYSDTHVTENHYNDLGQLEETTVSGMSAPMLYEYDDLGNQTKSGLDMDENGLLDDASTDRITAQNILFEYTDSQWWKTASTSIFATENDSTATTVSIQKNRLTGLGTDGLVSETIKEDVHNNQTISRVYIDSTERSRTQTVQYPDATNQAITETVNGLTTYTVNKTGVRTDFSYDDLERRTGVTDARTGLTTTHYNDNHRIDYIEDPAFFRTTFTYDPETGLKASSTNAKDFVTYYDYNDMGQLTHMWGSGAEPVKYIYDDYNRLYQLNTYRNGTGWDDDTWPEDSTGDADITTWNYQEETGLLLSKEDAGSNLTIYTYTPTGGKILTRTWARTLDSEPIVTTYVYDPLTAELTDIVYSDDTPDISFSYDRLGRKDTVTDAVGTRVFGYNDALKPETETITGLYDKVITRTYDTTDVPGRATGFSTGTDYSVTWGYETGTGRFQSLDYAIGSSTDTVTYTYKENSDLIGGFYSSTGLVTEYAYEDERNLKTRIQNTFNGVLISQYDSHYNKIGQRDTTTASGLAPARSMEAKVGQSWFDTIVPTDGGYEVLPDYKDYTFDNIGNRTDTTDWSASAGDFEPTTWNANLLNQYDSIIADSGTVSPAYDDNGNLTTYKNKIYTYNAENRLISVEPESPVAGSEKIAFIYDYLGRRVKKTTLTYSSGTWVEQSETLFLYEGWNLIAEMDASGTATRYYVWGLDLSRSLQGAGGIGGLIATINPADSTEYLYVYEPNGNIAQMVNASDGSIAASYEYDPFGNLTYKSGSLADENAFRFSTKYHDDETGLVYYGYRYYSPELGRWINRDPINELGHQIIKFEVFDQESFFLLLEEEMLLYVFLSNDGINKIDLNGELDWYKFVGCFAGLSADELRAIKGKIPKSFLNDPKVKKELSEEIGRLKKVYGAGWKKVRKKLIKEAQEKAVKKVVGKMGKKAFLKWLGGFAVGKAVPIVGQVSLVWDICKATYCAGVAM